MLIENEHQLELVKQHILDSAYLVVDVETHKTITYEGRHLLGVALACPVGLDLYTYYIVHPLWKQLQDVMEQKTWILHNARFDLEILKQNGFDFQRPFFDTMIMAHLIDQNFMSYELDHLALSLLRERKVEKMNLVEKAFGSWEKIPPSIMGEYAEQDVRVTWKLFSRLLGEMEKRELSKLWPDCMRYIRALQWICSIGIDVDWELLSELNNETAIKLNEIQQTLGFNPLKRNTLVDWLHKNEQGLRLPILHRTATGAPATDDKALRAYAERADGDTKASLGLLLDYRRLAKAKSTWYEGFQRRCGDTRRLYPGIKQHGTKTGRLSCAEPNLQQIPRDSARVKQLFLSRPGFSLIEFDYSQIELRVASALAKQYGDSRMFDTYLEGADVHTLTSELIGAFDHIANRSEARQVGKTGNFLWIYGGSANRLQNMLWDQYDIRASYEMCEEWTSSFHRAYPGFKRCLYRCTQKVTQSGYIQYWNKRRHYIPREFAHKAFNSWVQGGCGQVLMHGLIKLHELHKDGTIRSLVSNTVHDSVWVLVPEDDIERESEIIKKALSELPERVFKLPFIVDSKVMSANAKETVLV